MSSAGRAASSSGCVGRPREHETGLTGSAEQIQHSLPTGSSVMETAEHREPYESRGSRTVLGAPGGEKSSRRPDSLLISQLLRECHTTHCSAWIFKTAVSLRKKRLPSVSGMAKIA